MPSLPRRVAVLRPGRDTDVSRSVAAALGLVAIGIGAFLLRDGGDADRRQPIAPVTAVPLISTTTTPPTTTTTRAHPEGVDPRLDQLPHAAPTFRVDWRWDTTDPEEWVAYLEIELPIILNGPEDLHDYIDRLRAAKTEALAWVNRAGLSLYGKAWLPEEAADLPTLPPS